MTYNSGSAADKPRYLYRHEAMEYLGISDVVFSKLIRRGILQGHRSAHDHRRMLYRTDELDAVNEPQPAR
ncbi:hypothetical protein ACUY3M_03465 [Corynebacterium suicordis]|uniref:Helix-turn-helix domain-containing protein n=1 Tax=Corynebacterium suicordis DSM 45110 TaxID=1121369 RepID=A0ABR9ZH29_9CORY|nr:hypothetical protein [Corynebacterium suicordis]MBF4552726.1 hypothetical protein [Corynebacterium suicordis DSM 45110]MDR6278315.1 hypothetical protein [Corynebacterium suicordis]